MKMITKLAAAAAMAGIAGVAVAQTAHQGHGNMPMGNMDPAAMRKMMQVMMPSPNDAISTKEFKTVDMSMMKNMHVPYTGDADVDFRTHMIPHHQGAIDMAKVALKYAMDPETKSAAQKIIDDQEKEIADMRDWLEKHGH
jgi:uncharacterized protein (DUF305 family)